MSAAPLGIVARKTPPVKKTVTEHASDFLVPVRDDRDLDAGVEGNSRLTAAIGTFLLVALFIEGVTLVIGVDQLLALHVFIGFLVIPPVVLKLSSTGYRMIRYYTGDDRYHRKGPPHPVLRIIGPLVILSTVALLVTGVSGIAVGGSNSQNLVDLHQTAFIAWVVLMSIHVLGHLVETARYSAADWAPRRPRVRRIGVRRTLVVGSVVIGLGLGALSIGWASTWRTERDAKRNEFVGPGR